MAFDAAMLRFVTDEINRKLTGGKVDKIFQPGKEEAVFVIRCGGEVIVRMPGGTYIVRHSVGADWYGPEDGFGDGSWSDQEGPNCAGLRQEDRLMTFEDGMEYMLTVEVKTGDEHPWEEWGDFLQ